MYSDVLRFIPTPSRTDDNERSTPMSPVACCVLEKFSKLLGEAKIEATIGRDVNDYRIEPLSHAWPCE